MTAARVIVTTDTAAWAQIAGQTMTGYATSVIACDAEAGIERCSAPTRRPTAGRASASCVFAFSRDALEKACANRVGQCVMTCPTTACYNGLPLGEKTISVGGQAPLLRRRLADLQADRRPALLANPGDGRRVPLRGDLRHGQGGRRRQYHPDGDRARRPRCAATEAAVIAMRRCPDVILPFPGRHRALGIQGRQQVQETPRQHQHGLRPDAPRRGPDRDAGRSPLRLRDRDRRPEPGGRRACHGRRPPRRDTAGKSVLGVTSGNYGGNLGPFHIRLHDVWSRYPRPF